MSSERIKIPTVHAIPFINQLCIWTKKSGNWGVWYIQMRDIGVYFVRQSIGWLWKKTKQNKKSRLHKQKDTFTQGSVLGCRLTAQVSGTSQYNYIKTWSIYRNYSCSPDLSFSSMWSHAWKIIMNQKREVYAHLGIN